MRLVGITFLLCVTTNAWWAQDEARWRDVCNRAKSTPLPPPPPAGPLSPIALAGCDERALYYGIGGKADYTAALQCAWHQYTHPQNTVGNMFYGPGVLTMIYANGFGVPRNLDAAIRFACENEWAAPAEFSSRIPHLEKLGDHPTRFDLCDDITSGLSDGACTAIQTRKRAAARQRRINKLEKSFSPKARTAFTALRIAEENFEQARTRNEVDLSGTSRGAFALAEEDALQTALMDTLERLGRNAIPQATPATVARLREAVAYVFARGQNADSSMREALGTVKPEGVRHTQDQWNVLREGWVRFAKAAYPCVGEPSIRAYLLRVRLKQLLAIDPTRL